MKINVLFILMLVFTACSSRPKQANTFIHPILKPYVDNWKEQHIDWKKMHPEFTEKSIMPFTFDTKLGSSVVGRCQMNPDLRKRELFISPWVWNDYPKKREQYIIHLMNLCVGGDLRSDMPYGDFLYYGF
jgi:hypothetical protein